MSLLYGNPDLVELPTTRGRSSQSGPFITRSWKGTEEACNAALAEIVGADHAEVSGDGAVYTLTARFANDPGEPNPSEVPVREERLHFNRITKSIYEHPNFAGIAFGLKAEVRKAVESNATSSPASLQGEPEAITLYELLLAGVENYIVNQAVVVVTDTASATFAWNIGFTGVDSIYSTPAMIADAELTQGWADNLPPSTGAPAGFYYGWLKHPPEITTVGNNRSQLTQEFEFGLWSTELYDVIS